MKISEKSKYVICINCLRNLLTKPDYLHRASEFKKKCRNEEEMSNQLIEKQRHFIILIK